MRQKGFAPLLVLAFVFVVAVAVFFVAKGGLGEMIGSHGGVVRRFGHKGDCVENTNPLFTFSPTEIENISLISPPIMKVNSGIKSHSYIETAGPSPVYAPVDSVLVTGAKYTEDYVDASKIQYTLFFNVTCNVSYYYDHLINVPDKIAEVFPGEPLVNHSNSRKMFSVEIKAGELVGYSWSKQFDFGVLDNTTEPALKDFEEYKNSEKAYAVCPLKFFEDSTKEALSKKLGYFSSDDLTVIDNLCD